MDQTFSLTIQTPEKTLFKDEANMVRLETELGQLEIKPNHQSLMGSILFSSITVQHDDHDDNYYARQGVLRVDNATNSVDIMAFSVDKQSEVDHKTISEYREYVLNLLEKGEDLEQVQISFLEEQKASLDKMIDVVGTEIKE